MKKNRMLVSKEETLLLLHKENDSEFLQNLWPKVKAGLTEEKEEKKYPIPRWQWALRAAGLIIVLFLGVWFFNFLGVEKVSTGEEFNEPFRLNYVRINNKPARTYVFKGPDSNMTFVWVEENDNGEDL